MDKTAPTNTSERFHFGGIVSRMVHAIQGFRGSYRTMRRIERVEVELEHLSRELAELGKELVDVRKELIAQGERFGTFASSGSLDAFLQEMQSEPHDFLPETLFAARRRRITLSVPQALVPHFSSFFTPETRIAFPKTEHGFGDGDASWRFSDAVVLWGICPRTTSLLLLRHARGLDLPTYIAEDGFLKSVNPVVASGDVKWRVGISLTVDRRTAYYDGTRSSTLESWLNSSETVSPQELNRAKSLMRFIVEERLTKYNHQPIREPEIGTKGKKKVLVVDQSYGDYSIRRGCADENTFRHMLRCAIEENPRAEILVKTHPDTLAGVGGYLTRLPNHGNVIPITFPINPISLLLTVDRVYVVSSQFGFEALMCGKEVSVFGMPFYANWGLTDDRLRCARRTRTRSLEEVFAMAYMRYTHYCNPETGRRCSIEEAIQWLLQQRTAYQEEFGIPCRIDAKAA